MCDLLEDGFMRLADNAPASSLEHFKKFTSWLIEHLSETVKVFEETFALDWKEFCVRDANNKLDNRYVVVVLCWELINDA